MNTKLIAAFEFFLIAAGLLVLVLTLRPQICGDGLARFEAVKTLYEDFQIAPTKYALMQPLMTLPLYWVADHFQLHARPVVAYYNVILFILALPFLYLLIARNFEPETARRTILIVLSASMFPHHLQHYYGEVTTALLWILGVLTIKKRPLTASVLLACSVLNTPAFIPVLALTMLALAVVYKKPRFLFFPIFITLCFAAENYMKFGNALSTPYLADVEHGFATIMPFSGEPGFSYPIVFGALSILFSFGKGLIFFIPSTLLFFSTRAQSIIRSMPMEAHTVGVFSILAVLLYSKWWAWYGGFFWGPRFFLFLCIPGAIVAAKFLGSPGLTRPGRASVFTILIFSTWVGINGYLFGQEGQQICQENDYALEALCWYTPEFSVLFRPFIVGLASLVQPSNNRLLFVGWQIFVLLYLLIANLLVQTQANTTPLKPAS